ncbi:hypothetical protein SLA2020_136680 [Shorea laevis]
MRSPAREYVPPAATLVKIQQLDDGLGRIFTLRSSRSVDQTTQEREKDCSWRCQESGRPERKGPSAILTRSVIAQPLTGDAIAILQSTSLGCVHFRH